MEATGKNFVKRILSSFQLYLLHIPSLKDKPLRTIKCQSSEAKHFKKMFQKNYACSPPSPWRVERILQNEVLAAFVNKLTIF